MFRFRIKRAVRALFAASAVGTMAAAMATSQGCTEGADVKTFTSPCPDGQACQVRLTLFHTSDIHSRLLPYDLLITQIDGNLGLGPTGEVRNVGGVARMAYILNRERARADRALHIDSGDCFQGAPIFNFFSGEPEMRAMTYLGTEAAVIGNHEFDKGATNAARQIQRWANFPVLGANYKPDAPDRPDSTHIGNVLRPFQVFDRDGLKVAVIGMGNLSSMTSIFDQPNRSGLNALNTVEVAQFYIDLLRPYVDVIAFTTHMGLEVDQRMIRETTGIDVVLGGHNHIVINPPQELTDCTADPAEPGFIWVTDPNASNEPNPPESVRAKYPDFANHPYQIKRPCKPRRVVLAHSGAFSKYVGRLDLVVSNNPADVSPTGRAEDYEPVNRFEVMSVKYAAFPINAQVPEDPAMVDMLQPYRRVLDVAADLDILAGYSPAGAKRVGPQKGDSALGNLVASAIWLRLGIQTDFALTNSTGIRQDLLPGPVTIEQMYNIFPFDNSIAKMQLSGLEVQQMFDFVSRRSQARGCGAQAQIAGARIQLNCAGCSRKCKSDTDCATWTGARCDLKSETCSFHPCSSDADCSAWKGGTCDLNSGVCDIKCVVDSDCRAEGAGGSETCELASGRCMVQACAEQIFIGQKAQSCTTDAECAGPDEPVRRGQCDRSSGKCWSPVFATNLYELATSTYLAGGGSGYRVLQRNTTQFDTKIQQRDALIDFIRAGKPCGYDPKNETPDGLRACAVDADCGSSSYVCSCLGNSVQSGAGTCQTEGECEASGGRCVLRACRDEVASFHNRICETSPDREGCRTTLGACVLGGEQCKFLACVDETLGAATDGRVEMLGR